ncbi:MAG TPA: M20 family metallopeptidase [Candidatus Paceibacterota bacterium]
MNEVILALAMKMQAYVVQVRRELHQCPETRYETTTTRSVIEREIRQCKPELEQLGLQVNVNNKSKGGIWVDIVIDPKLDRIALRADIDALPVEEKTGLPFISENPGKMHACGHDCHSAMLLGFIQLLAMGEVKLAHNLRLIWEDAEENPGTAPIPESGSELLIKDGVMESVKAIYGLHIWNNPNNPHALPGVFSSRPGALLGNSGRLMMKIKARGGHVAMPSSGGNALRMVNAVMNQFNTFLARNMSPTDPATLEPVIVNSGKASNVMPAEAEVWYGFRTMLHRDKHLAMMGKLVTEAKVTVESMGGEITETKVIGGHPSLLNDPAKHKLVVEMLKGGEQLVEEHLPILGGESFAHYLYHAPGAFFMLGAYTPGTGDHHTPTFSPDESVLWKGVLYWLLLAIH